MNGEQYILSFDLSEINRQIAELQNSYTSLTDSFKKSADESEDQLKSIEDSVKDISSSLDASFLRMERFYTSLLGNLKSTTEYFEKLEAHSKAVTENLTGLGNVDLSKLQQGAPDDTAAERIAAIDPTAPGASRFKMSMQISAESDEVAEDALKKAEMAIKAAQKALKESQEAQSLIVSTTKKLSETIKREVKGAKSKMMGIASKGTMGAVGGGILTGLIGMMIMGVQEKQRMGAERGEMLNVFEAIGDVFSKESKKAVGWFSRFAEQAQWYFGIGRKEVQGVVKQLVDAGYKSEQILTDYSASISDVEANVVTLTLGIDKHLNQASGTSMQNVVKLVENYGDSLDDAADKYKRLAFEAQKSGMGVNKFIDAIMSGSSALTQYGIDMEDVVEVMGKMQEYYESMGLEEQFAGGQAAQAVKGIVGGIAGLDEGTMAALAQRMFGALGLNGIEAIQMFKEGAARVASGEDKDFLIKASKELALMAREASGGRRAVGIRFLESRGLTNQQATALYDVADKLEAGTKMEELSAKEQKALNNAFKTEGKKLTKLQKTQRSLIKGLAKIGEGLMKILTSLLGTVIVGIKSIPAAISAAVTYMTDPTAGAKQFDELKQALSEQLSGTGEGVDLLIEGGKQTGSAVGGALGDVGRRLEGAIKYDPGGMWSAMGQSIQDAGNAIQQIMTENEARDLWLEELQSSFNKRLNDLGQALGLVSEKEARAMEELDNMRAGEAADRLERARSRSAEASRRLQGSLMEGRSVVKQPEKQAPEVREQRTKPIPERYPGKVRTVIEAKHLAKSEVKRKMDVVD